MAASSIVPEEEPADLSFSHTQRRHGVAVTKSADLFLGTTN